MSTQPTAVAQERDLWSMWSNLCGLAVAGAIVILTFDLPPKETGIVAVVAMLPALLLERWLPKTNWVMRVVGAGFLGALLIRLINER
jgi:hydrogenase/urease accessory protein HupE